jgi:hypothetical protein
VYNEVKGMACNQGRERIGGRTDDDNIRSVKSSGDGQKRGDRRE